MNFIIFASVFLLVMAAANYYIYRRFFRVLTPTFARYGWIVPALLMLGEAFFVLDISTNIVPDSPALYFITSAFVGFTFMLFVVATFYDLTVTVSRRVPFDRERRKTIKVIFDVTMLIAAMSYLLRGLAQGLAAPQVNRVAIRIKDLPFERLNIVQLTDIHVGRTIKREFIAELVAQANALSPDLVVITGDLVDLPIDRIRADLAPLAELNAPTYFIPGNHEYFHGPQAVFEHVRSLGIRPLLNESVVLEHGGGRFNLLGITDMVGERIGFMPPDLQQAYRAVDTSLPCIVLAHQPKTILRMDGYRCDLMLSGHTHGGQIFPFGLLVMVDQPYLAGLHRHGAEQQIFVSRGTGYWGPPLRILAPSEISLLELTPAA